MDRLTSPEGSVALAITALLVVLGVRLARPGAAREWLAVAAYVAALVVLHLAARGLLPGGALEPRPAHRLGGAALLVAGLVLAGTSARARLRAATAAAAAARAGAPEPLRAQPRAPRAVYAGLAIVAVGQLLRAPSTAGAAAVLAAVLLCAFAALAPARAA